MTRAEHLQWAKDRALEYVDMNDLIGAFASIVSDLRKHSLLSDHSGITTLGPMLLDSGHLSTARAMRDFITGFH
jgi:hypothetical protein